MMGSDFPWGPLKVSDIHLPLSPAYLSPSYVEPRAPGRPSTLNLSEHLQCGPSESFPKTYGRSCGASSAAPPGLDFPPTLLERLGPLEQSPYEPRVTKHTRRMAISNFIRTPKGAEEICSKLDSANQSYCEELVAAILPDLPHLACDPQGIQVLSKLLALGSQEVLRKLALRMRGSILKLTKDKHGCWFLQQALLVVPSELQESIHEELRGKVLACSQHLHGNFVLQKCVEQLPGSIPFVLKELKNHVLEAAMHVYSCRVLQRILEQPSKHLSPPDMIGVLEILLRPDNLQKLVLDPYGSNVIRTVLACGTALHVQRIIKVFTCEQADLLAYARNRHGSLVLERCLETLNGDLKDELQTEREALMTAILESKRSESPVFLQIALDRFGNYVVQKIIEISSSDEQQRVQELLRSLCPKLRRAANGRHILQAARKRFGLTLASVTELGWCAQKPEYFMHIEHIEPVLSSVAELHSFCTAEFMGRPRDSHCRDTEIQAKVLRSLWLSLQGFQKRPSEVSASEPSCNHICLRQNAKSRIRRRIQGFWRGDFNISDLKSRCVKCLWPWSIWFPGPASICWSGSLYLEGGTSITAKLGATAPAAFFSGCVQTRNLCS